MRTILFSDEDEKAYGSIYDFENSDEFEKEVQEQLGYKIKLLNVKVEVCIFANSYIPVDTIMPFDESGIEICNCYTADIEKVEEE